MSIETFEVGPFRCDVISDGRLELKRSDFINPGSRSGGTFRSQVRMLIDFNTLLIRGEGHTILVDPGTGDKPLRPEFAGYHLEWPRRVASALRELGVDRDSVDTVVLTHLHWDHCGAGTRVSKSGDIVPAFPRARYYVQRHEYEDAVALSSGDHGYVADDFVPLYESGALELQTGSGEIYPWLHTELVGGHSRGLQVVYVGFPNGPRAAYLSDLVPTVAQLSLSNVYRWDVDAEELRESKLRVLKRVADERMLCVFVHSPRRRIGFVAPAAPGGFRFESAEFQKPKGSIQ